jgi:hypothetical protein
MVENLRLNRQSQAPMPVYHTRFPRPPGPVPAALDFYLGARHEPIRIPTTRTIIIGRSDSDYNNRPDVDLSVCGGYKHGVSRRHALISSQDGYMVLIGLNSSSGTYVNGQETAPGQAVPIFDGDELAFGGVVLHIAFVRAGSPSRV